MENPTLYLECNNCGMKFEALEQINTHKSKFCIGSDYYDSTKLQKILNQATKEKNEVPLNLSKSIDASEDFLKAGSRNQFNSELNLNNLRADINSKQQEFSKVASKLSNKEEILREQLENLSNKANGDGSDLLRLMTDLQEKKLMEVKALKEKELMTRALKDLDKKNLNALEYQKKLQLKNLSEERENLKKQEEELFNDLQRMKARLLEDEKMRKIEKDKINLNIVTVKDVNQELMEKRLEELSNNRGKEISGIKEKKEMFEIEKEKIENELRSVQKGEVSRKNNSGIMAGSNILGQISPLNLEDRRNLPEDVVKKNQKWKEDYEKLNLLKKNYEEYVKNEPGYDVKPASRDSKPKFSEEMQNMLGFYDTNLKANQKARVLEYIKEDLDMKDPINPRPKPNETEKTEKNDPLKYNAAKYKLSSEPYQFNLPQKSDEKDLYSPQVFNKYKQEAKNNYLSESNLMSKPKISDNFQSVSFNKAPDDSFNNEKQGVNRRQTPEAQNPKSPYPINPYLNSIMPFNPYTPYFPYNQYSPFYPGYQDPYQTKVSKINPETEKLKQELKSLKAMLKKNSKNQVSDPRALENVLNLPSDDYDTEKIMPEERVIEGLIQQEKEELKILNVIPRDSELYQAKLNHYKEMSMIRTRMEASLQELALQRMRRNITRDEVMQEKKLAEEILREEQRKMQALNRLAPPEPNKDYSPSKGLYIAWDYLTGIPQKFKKAQVAYGVYEKTELRMDPRLVAPQSVETDPSNSLANRCFFREVHDLKKLPPYPQIVSSLQVQGIDPFNKESAVGWTVLELFTNDKKVQEGYWKIPVYRNPQVLGISLNDLQVQVFVPNAFLYLRVFAADNAKSFPAVSDFSYYKVPVIHSREQYLQQSNNNSHLVTLQSRGENSNNNNRMPTNQSRQVSGFGSRLEKARNEGIWIRIETLKNFRSRSLIKLKLTLKKADQILVDDRGAFCIWTSESINMQAADVSLNNISRQNSRQVSANDWSKEISINKQTSFLKDFLQSLGDNNWNDDLVLVIEILEKNSRRISVAEGGLSSDVDSFFLIAWGLFVLSDHSRKILNFGTVELNLYKPPMPEPLDHFEAVEQVSGSLKLTIQEASQSTGTVQNGKTGTLKEAFLENLHPQYDDGKLFVKGDGIDVYVDAGRFFPDNTSCTKIVVKAMTSNLDSIGTSVGGLSDLNSEAYSPVYAFRTEFRTPLFNPTTTLVVSIVTIDTSNNEVRVLGYSAINLFLNKFRKTQPTEANEEEFILNAGAFQLPIYCQEPYRRVPFNLTAFTKLEMIPCATLLVRIREAPKAQQGVRVLSIKDVPKNEWYIRGLIVPPPNYDDRVYNTSFCMPSPAERAIYTERIKRTSPTVNEVTQKVMQALGFRLDLNEEETMKWIMEKLVINPTTPIIDLKYFAKYSQNLGFKISIDAIHHISKKRPHVVLYTINPPANFYSQSVISQDIQVADKIDWNSSFDTPIFLDGWHTYKNIKFTQNLHVIIDLRAVNIEEKSLEPIAWTILPVFFQDGYVRSGIYQVPFFAGPVPANTLADIANNEPWEFLLDSARKPGGPAFYDPISVIVRLVDCQREGHFNVPMDLNRIDYSYIPEVLLGKFSYNSAAFQKNQDGPTMKTIVPKDISSVSFGKIIHEIVVTDLDLPHL